MEFELGTAIVAGLVATTVMTVLMYMGSIMGIRMDMPLMLGSMFMKPGAAARAVGLVAHFMAGTVFFIVYAVLFDAFGLSSSLAGWGALFGAVHGLGSGMMMTMMGTVHPRMATNAGNVSSDELLAPGIFGVNYGTMAPIGIIALHVVFGVVAGAVYAA